MYDKINKLFRKLLMKKLICLFLQVMSLTVWFVYVVDKHKINLLLDSSAANSESLPTLCVCIATIVLILSIIVFMIPDKNAKSLYKI